MYFTLVVPIYGVEPYLRECLDSIRGQSFTDFEAVLVDDGSPDECGSICDAYADMDSRFCVIHKPNGGLVSARKAGTAGARGRYIINLDGDDYISPDMLSKAYAIAEEYAPDVISFSLRQFSEASQVILSEPAEPGFYDKDNTVRKLLPIILPDKKGKRMQYFLCGKAIKTELQAALQTGVPDKVSFCEDVCCLTGIYLRADSVYVSPEAVYNYRVRSNSDSRSFNVRQFEQLTEAVKHLSIYENTARCDFSPMLCRFVLMTCCVLLIHCCKARCSSCLGQMSDYLKAPVLACRCRRAVFEGLSPGTRIIMYLLSRGRARAAYMLYNLSDALKGLLKKQRSMT